MSVPGLIRRIAENDNSVKLLFDHVRNVGICAIVFGAALWKYDNLSPGVTFYLDVFIIGLLVVFGLFLFFVNQTHGILKLRAASHPSWVLAVVMHTYPLVVVSIAYSIVRPPL